MTIDDAALDEFSANNVKYHPSALYAFLFLFLGLRMYKACWESLFRHSTIIRSAKKILFLKILIVAQSLCIGGLVDDLIFQHVQETVTFPKIPFLFVTFIGFICEIVFALTRCFRPTMEHAVLSHFVPFILSVILHIAYIRSEPFNAEWEIISLYAASLFALFWSDIRQATVWEKETLAALGEVGHTLVLQTARSLESFSDGLSSLGEATAGLRTLTDSVMASPILSRSSYSWISDGASETSAATSSASTVTGDGTDGESSEEEGSTRSSVASSVPAQLPLRRSARLQKLAHDKYAV